MTDTAPAAERPPALGEGTANKTPGSQVEVLVKPEPAAFLRLDTGEVVFVPAPDTTALNNEFDKWNRLVYEQLLANDVLALADERLVLIANAKAADPNSVSTTLEKDAKEAQALAIEWRQQATEALRTEMQALDKLGDSGKKLIEMVPLKDKPADKAYGFTPGKDNGQWKLKGLDLKTTWGFKSAAGLKKHFTQEARYRGLGPLRVMSSDKLKASWPQFKDKKPGGNKCSDVYKADASGKRKVDRAKLRSYLGEQVQQARLKSTDFAKLEVNATRTLGPEALEKWNANAHASREGRLVWGDTQLGDVDFSAEAAAMRFYSGGSLSGELAPLQGSVNIKAEGSVEVAFAEGKVAGSLYLPSKEGLMLYYLDLEQLSDLSKGKSADKGRYDLGAVRLACSAELKGVIGASLAGEVSIGVEMKDVQATDVDGKTKPGKMPHLKGSRKKTKRTSAADVTGQADDWKDTAGVAAEVNFFAGAKGGVGISGAIEWRNPHSKDKKFEVFASIAPELQGMVGLAGEAKLNIEYVDGIFRITVHAGLCFGVGAEGTVSLAVGAKQLASFVYWLYYNLLNMGFRSAVFIAKDAFKAFQWLGYLLVCEEKRIDEYFGKLATELDKLTDRLDRDFDRADKCLALAGRILANPETVRLSTPESKGMLIYQLTRHSAANWVGDGAGLFDSYLPAQRRAVLAVLRQTQLKRDLENVIQHIHPTGVKTNFEKRLAELKRFFAAEGPHGIDVPGSRTGYQDQFENLMRQRGFGTNFVAATPAARLDIVALNGNFDDWYEQVHASLMDEPVRGYAAVANSDFAYALVRDGAQRDHPLFASTEGGLYDAMT